MNEDFVKLYGSYELAKAVKERPFDPQLKYGLEERLREEIPVLPSFKEKSPEDICVIAGKASEGYQKDLVDYVNDNTENLVGDVINEKNALGLVIGLKPYSRSPRKELIEDIQRNYSVLELAKKNPEAHDIMKAELSQYDKNGILEAIFNYNPEWIAETYKGLIGMKERELALEFNDNEGKLDVGKVKGYVGRNLQAVPDEEKLGVYMGFANMVAKHYQQQLEAAQEATRN